MAVRARAASRGRRGCRGRFLGRRSLAAFTSAAPPTDSQTCSASHAGSALHAVTGSLRAALQAQATGALDTATEAALYGLLQRGGRSFVSVGHREQLVQWHTHVLEHAGGPRWRLSTRQEFLARRQAGAGGAEQPG